jgi:superfamily II DNA helicase RecQ
MLLKRTDNPVVIVVSPLISLMANHIEEAKSLGLRALQLPTKDQHKCDPTSCDVVFGSAEFWTSYAGADVLDNFSSHVVLVTTDEAHVAPKWYDIVRHLSTKCFKLL